MKKFIVLTFYVISCIAEPPLHNRYLPPQQSFNSAPSQIYGVPGASGLSRQNGALSRIRQPVQGRLSSSAFVPSQPSAQYLPNRLQTLGSENAPNPSRVYDAPEFGLNGAQLGQGAFVPQAASRQYLPPGVGRAGYNDGSNGEPANYNFEYMVQDAQSGNDFGHREVRLGDRAEGSYYVLLPDGRKQMVQYEADQGGYRPRISYEDTGSALAAYRNTLSYNGYNNAGGPY